MGVEIEGTLIKDQNSFWSTSDDDLIEFLKKDLQITRWDKAIIEGVPEDKVKILEKWIKKNKGKIEGVDLSIKPTLTGLTVEEEELFENEYRLMFAVDRIKLIENKIKRIQTNLATQYISGSEPQREDAQLRWWKQKLETADEQDNKNADRLDRENEAVKENQITAKELEDAQTILEKHSHIGKGPRKHNSLLNNFIDNFDKEFCKNRKKKLSAEGLELKIKEVLTNNLEKYSFVIEAEDVNDCIKWSDDKGKIQSSPWGDAMRARIARIRKKRNPH